jgi:hypothetical protein
MELILFKPVKLLLIMNSLLMFNIGIVHSDSGQPKIPSLEQVEQLETDLKMPDGARDLAMYARYYTISYEEGLAIILGVYVLNDKSKGIHLVEFQDLPLLPLDGGCGIIFARFDYQSKSTISIKCSGLA